MNNEYEIKIKDQSEVIQSLKVNVKDLVKSLMQQLEHAKDVMGKENTSLNEKVLELQNELKESRTTQQTITEQLHTAQLKLDQTIKGYQSEMNRNH